MYTRALQQSPHQLVRVPCDGVRPANRAKLSICSVYTETNINKMPPQWVPDANFNINRLVGVVQGLWEWRWGDKKFYIAENAETFGKKYFLVHPKGPVRTPPWITSLNMHTTLLSIVCSATLWKDILFLIFVPSVSFRCKFFTPFTTQHAGVEISSRWVFK